MATKQHFEGKAELGGELQVTRLDLSVLAVAEARVAGLGGRIWATARYEDGNAKVRLYIAIPYDDDRGREAIHAIDLDDEANTPFDAAFSALVQTNMPGLLLAGRKAAARCLIAAEAAGEL